MSTKHNRKQIAAIHLAIQALNRERRGYAAGEYAYQSGIRKNILKGGITGEAFGWAESDHVKYEEYTKAISEMWDLIEMMDDEPAVIIKQQMKLFDDGFRCRCVLVDDKGRIIE